MNGKWVVVTGANGALGSAVVEVALSQGANVIAVDLQFANQRSDVTQVTVDLTDATAVKDAVVGIASVDALFNVAGGFDMGPAVHETDPALWDKMFKMNVETMRNMCAAVVPRMLSQGHGKIVNIGALSAREGQGNMGAYCVAKSAVMRITESMAKELRNGGINVNAVLPSIIDTPTNRNDMPDAKFEKWVSTKDLAAVICFLGSDGANAVHGALVPVTGLS